VNGPDEHGFLRVVLEGAADFGNQNGQVGVLDECARPDPALDFGLCDDRRTSLEEQLQEVERLGRQVDRACGQQKLPCIGIEREGAKSDAHGSSCENLGNLLDFVDGRVIHSISELIRMTDPARPPSGRTILKAIRDELMLNLYPLPFSTLPSTIYHVYLHPRDFGVIEAIAPRIVEQVQRALTSEVQRLNTKMQRAAPGMLTRLLGRSQRPAPIELPPAGWEIHIQPDPDGEVKPGELGIVSTLSLARVAEYSGTPTTRIVKSVVGGGRRTATTSHVQQTDGASRVPESLADASERARLTYEDEQGPHVFSMRKDSLSVGRGGRSAWVDVQVVTTPKVSREHCRIRRDRAGRFFIQDVSSWGTSVNGQAVPAAIKSAEGVLQPGPEQELPPQARIALADALVIEFEASHRS
jgi:hypothetical protein